MSTADHQEKLKEEAKAIRERIDKMIKDTDLKTRVVRLVCVYAGMITETLIEYEEPDVVMEQAFHRIADLLRTDPEEGEGLSDLMPYAYALDHDTELGRQLGRSVADKLPKGLDDLHEIAIALIINDFPLWAKHGYTTERLLRLLIEAVIGSLTYEMATQDFCDLLIEEYMAEGDAAGAAIQGLAAVSGNYFAEAQTRYPLPDDAEQQLTNVMVRESIRHGTGGPKNWTSLAPSNDMGAADATQEQTFEFMKKIKPQIEEFFVLIGLDDALGRAVAVAKSVGRMVAVITVEDIGQMHPSIAKSLAKTGMILGARYQAKV